MRLFMMDAEDEEEDEEEEDDIVDTTNEPEPDNSALYNDNMEDSDENKENAEVSL